MSDAWSLKDKEYNLVWYCISDIDVLREKLVDDFMDYYDRYLRYQIDENPNRHNFNYDIKKTINKRFGVV